MIGAGSTALHMPAARRRAVSIWRRRLSHPTCQRFWTMTIATISAVSFVLGATVAYVANRYPGHREVIDAVGGALLIGWALLTSLLNGRDTSRRSRPERNRLTTTIRCAQAGQSLDDYSALAER
jgi:hypothetical protein